MEGGPGRLKGMGVGNKSLDGGEAAADPVLNRITALINIKTQRITRNQERFRILVFLKEALCGLYNS